MDLRSMTHVQEQELEQGGILSHTIQEQEQEKKCLTCADTYTQYKSKS
jgi:hypothetical protein